jgi:hypothetical protein
VFRNRPVALLLTGLSLWQAGCTSYRQISIAEVPDHGKIRVTLRDGGRQVLRDPTVDADSLRGRDERSLANGMFRVVAIPLDHVTEVEGTRTNVGATVALTTGIVLLAAFVVLVSCVDGEGSSLGPQWSC